MHLQAVDVQVDLVATGRPASGGALSGVARVVISIVIIVCMGVDGCCSLSLQGAAGMGAPAWLAWAVSLWVEGNSRAPSMICVCLRVCVAVPGPDSVCTAGCACGVQYSQEGVNRMEGGG